MKIAHTVLGAFLLASAATTPVLAQNSMMSSSGKQTEMTHAARADKERMAAGKEAAAAKKSHYSGNHKMAARHHKMAAAHDRAAAAAQDKAAMAATPQQ